MERYELILDEEQDIDGVQAISLVSDPAIESNFIALNKDKIQLAAVNDEKRILMGAALIPNKSIYRRDGNLEYEVFFTDVTIPKENIVGKRGEGWAVANATLGHERGSLANPNAMMNRLNELISRMKEENIDGVRLIDIPVYRDKLITIQSKVTAFQSNSLRVLSSKLNKNQDSKLAGMIQKLVGTELRHELEGFAVDIMGEMGTLYEDSPHLRDGGSWQFLYMYYLGLIIGGGTSQIQKNIISERGLGMPREPKVQGV